MCFNGWKDHTKYLFELGGHNCTHRAIESVQTLQPGLIKHLNINGLSDDFVKIHGDLVMYSRITNISKTQIDYIFSNSNLCSYFQYIDMLEGLDHKVVIARYDIPMVVLKETIPKDRFFAGWVISRQLECDESFLKQVKLYLKKFQWNQML